MTKEEDFKLLKIQTCSLRVNIHCGGCNQKVKKLLQKMEGVYQVKIEAEHQKVTVSGCVDSATLINKLLKAGKHAELWSPSLNPKQQQQPQNPNKTNDVNKKQGSAKSGVEVKPKKGEAFVTEQEEEGEAVEVQLPKPVNQQQQALVNSKKNGAAALKKANQKQTQNIQTNIGAESNEIGALMDLAGFNAANPPNGFAGGNGIPQVQAPPLNNINGASNHSGMMMNLNGYNPMNMQTRQMMHQPHQQMMYQRSSFIPAPTNGYYYTYTTPNPYSYYPYNYPYPTSTSAELQLSCHSSATPIASNEDTSHNISCNIM